MGAAPAQAAEGEGYATNRGRALWGSLVGAANDVGAPLKGARVTSDTATAQATVEGAIPSEEYETMNLDNFLQSIGFEAD